MNETTEPLLVFKIIIESFDFEAKGYVFDRILYFHKPSVL